eukprot:sb/3478678/
MSSARQNLERKRIKELEERKERLTELYAALYAERRGFVEPGNSISRSGASAPIGCASSKVFFITHPASPGVSFRPFQPLQLCAHRVFYEGAVCRLDTA